MTEVKKPAGASNKPPVGFMFAELGDDGEVFDCERNEEYYYTTLCFMIPRGASLKQMTARLLLEQMAAMVAQLENDIEAESELYSKIEELKVN